MSEPLIIIPTEGSGTVIDTIVQCLLVLYVRGNDRHQNSELVLNSSFPTVEKAYQEPKH